jgi:hypothetical protein
MNKSELKKDFLEFVTYLNKMAIIHGDHCHSVEHKKTGDSGMKNTGKSSDADISSSGYNSRGIAYEGGTNKASDRDRTKSGYCRSSDSTGSESCRPGSRRLASTRRSVWTRSAICPTLLTLERTKLLSCCQSTRKRKMPTRRRRASKLWARTERRMTTVFRYQARTAERASCFGRTYSCVEASHSRMTRKAAACPLSVVQSAAICPGSKQS